MPRSNGSPRPITIKSSTKAKGKGNYRNWCFTCFNTDKSFQLDTNIKYIIWQREISPDTKRAHLQGYVEFTRSCRLHQAKSWLGDETIHLERRNGPRLAAIRYCKKEDTRDPSEGSGPFELISDTGVSQGSRTDLSAVFSSIEEGSTLLQILERYPSAFIRYHKGIQQAIAVYKKSLIPKWRDIKVFCYYGDTGTGKTRKVIEQSGEDWFKLDQNSDSKVWWDGYNGQKNIIIDDFYGWIKYGHLLNVLDGHPLRLAVKGSFAFAAYTTVYITSNKHPEDWYKQGLSEALERRFTKGGIYQMKWKDDDYTTNKVICTKKLFKYFKSFNKKRTEGN